MNATRKILIVGILTTLFASLSIGLTLSLTDSNPENELTINSLENYIQDTEFSDYIEGNFTDASLDLEEIVEIISELPEVQEFLEVTQDYELYVYYDGEGYWYISLFSLEDWMSYVYVIVDDEDGSIFYVESFNLDDETNLSTDDVLDIALAHDEIQSFVENNPEYEYYIYYDYYQYWYVDFYATNSYSWCYITIDDLSGDIIDFYSSDNMYNASLTAEEVLSIALTDLDVQNFIVDNPNYEYYIYLTDFYNTFDEDATDMWSNYSSITWIVDFFSSDYEEWISILIDDETAQIVDKWMTTPATKDESEIESIVYSIYEVQEFQSNYTNVTIDFYYDGMGTWYVWVWSDIQWDAYIFIEIDDLTGEIIYIESYFPTPPSHTEQEIQQFIFGLEEVQEFLDNTTDYEIWISYYYGFWYVEIIDVENGFALWIEIDDLTLEVVSTEYFDYSWDIL